jgi:hypothetical protein
MHKGNSSECFGHSVTRQVVFFCASRAFLWPKIPSPGLGIGPDPSVIIRAIRGEKIQRFFAIPSSGSREVHPPSAAPKATRAFVRTRNAHAFRYPGNAAALNSAFLSRLGEGGAAEGLALGVADAGLVDAE